MAALFSSTTLLLSDSDGEFELIDHFSNENSARSDAGSDVERSSHLSSSLPEKDVEDLLDATQDDDSDEETEDSVGVRNTGSILDALIRQAGTTDSTSNPVKTAHEKDVDDLLDATQDDDSDGEETEDSVGVRNTDSVVDEMAKADEERIEKVEKMSIAEIILCIFFILSMLVCFYPIIFFVCVITGIRIPLICE